MDFIADYNAEEMDVHLTTNRQEALLTFLTPQGWVGIHLGRTELEAFQKRIASELARRIPPALQTAKSSEAGL